MPASFDAIIIGAGLSGLVAACELADAGRSVLILIFSGRTAGREAGKNII